MTRNLLPDVKAILDGFTVTGDGSNGLANGVTHQYDWSELGEHLGTTGKQMWGQKVSDPHTPASIGGGAEEGQQRIQVDIRWPLNGGDGNILNQTSYEQLVEDAVHTLIRNNETSFGGTSEVVAHITDARSVVEDAGKTVVRGISLDILIQRIETYA